MCNKVTAQTTIYSEDFENLTTSPQTNLNNTNSTGWNNINRLGTENRWWILGGTSINAITNNYSLAISRNTPHTGGGTKPRYNRNRSAENIAQSPLIDATGYTSVTLDFDWICEAEISFDFGRVAYSFDGINWTIINQDYVSESSVQNEVNLDLSAVNGQSFYLGFYWENDNSVSNNPSFTVDNIVVKGTLNVSTPANDECSNAIVLTPDTSCNSVTGTTVDATQSLAGCAGTADDDVWYSFVATSTSHTVTVDSGNISDIVFEVFDGGCGVNSLVCEDNTFGASSETSTLTNLTIGTTYHIRVYSYSSVSNRSGTFSICVIENVINRPPANDECSNAIVLTPDTSCNSVTGTTVDATQSLAGCAGTADDDVWYSFVATSTSHTVTVDSGNISDIVFEVFDGGCGVNSLVCEDNTFGASSETSTLTNLTIGATYHTRVYSYSSVSNRSGTFSICVIENVTPPPPANDECSNAIVLTPDTSCNQISGTTVDATQSLAGCAGTADDDVWYSFVANATEHTITVEADTIRNIVFEVFESSCGGTDLICVDNTSGTEDETTTFLNLTIGTTYFVRVYSRGNDSNSRGSFLICVTHPSLIPSPANDECSDAELLIPNFECTPTLGTTIGATETQIGCDGTADDDVWYSFRATRAQHTIIVEAGTINDIVFEVFSRGCNGTSLLCENGSSGSSTETATVVALNVGTRYFLRVYSASGNTNDSGTFSICILELCVPSTDIGTTELECPSIDIEIDGTPDTNIDVSCSNDGTELEADYLDIKDTSGYDVVLLDDFNPPFQFNCLLNPISVNVDDVWSSEITLPFNFSFYETNYSSLIIGSNGVISFRSELAGLSAGWVIENDIPSSENSDAGFFGPSIFGVHHDMDPSKGGEIGYQLITLDNGCRAFVTAWDEVPMYLDNEILYSGMIVLYENTNIIDIYIKEKNLDAGDPWNDGNATVGLQGSATVATVPAGRNSLSNDWTAINEAYRFTPNGSSIATLNWYEDGNLIVDAVNSGQIIVNPSETTTYTAEVTYDFTDDNVDSNDWSLVESNTIDVNIIGQKTWNGSQSRIWNDPNNWTPVGVPLPENCVTIPGTGNNPLITSSIDGNGQTLTIDTGATLTQESNSTLTIEKDVTVSTGGTYNLQNSASLIQVDDVVNTVDGMFAMDRTTTIRSNDYVYWSSPVTNFNIENVSSGTPNGYKYQWLPFVDRTPGPQGPLNFGEWDSYNNGAMDIGKGYIIKGPNGHSSTPSPYTATFTGNPNNGEIIQPIMRSDNSDDDYTYQPYAGGDLLLITSDDDNWNLIGNPYPSAINVSDFLTLPANSNINGFVYIWTHGNDISTGNTDPFYEDYAYNYNVADYIAVNSSGVSDPVGFRGNIGAGQGFFVLMNDNSGNTTESVTFNNSMRSSSNNNDEFYRSSDTNDDDNKNRIWLDYISPNSVKNTTLVAYVDGATNDEDRMFDALKSKGSGLNLYSLIDDKGYLIQGRQLPFNDNDIVRLGLNITEPGIQTFAINTLQGLFTDSNNDIFLEDLQNGVIHNLKESPYVFNSNIGIVEDRFILKYSNSTLDIDDFDTPSGIKVFDKNEQIVVSSSYEPIKSVEVFDILGRTISLNKKVNLNRITIEDLRPEERVLFLKITLTDGKQKIEKIIF